MDVEIKALRMKYKSWSYAEILQRFLGRERDVIMQMVVDGQGEILRDYLSDLFSDVGCAASDEFARQLSESLMRYWGQGASETYVRNFLSGELRGLAASIDYSNWRP